MSEKTDINSALELCGFVSGDQQESRLMSLLTTILKLQTDPPIPLTFGEIYDQLLMDSPEAKLTKAWVHRVLKSLVETQMVRLESPSSRRNRYIADVNTVMAGLEQLKTIKLRELEAQKSEIDRIHQEVSELDCGSLAQQFVRNVTGTKQKISSRIVRGVEELHSVIKYNMTDGAKKGDVIRITVLWIEPFMDRSLLDRSTKFIDAAKRGAEVRYMISMDVFNLDEMTNAGTFDAERAMNMVQNVLQLKQAGIKFDVRIYAGPKTYNQVGLNRDNMALIISENPVTATWITRDFNPDLIDNAVKTFDRDWKKAKSFLEMTPKDFQAFGAEPGGLISKIVSGNSKPKADG